MRGYFLYSRKGLYGFSNVFLHLENKPCVQGLPTKTKRMKHPFLYLVLLILPIISFLPANAQKKPVRTDVRKITLPIKTARFSSKETENALLAYREQVRTGKTAGNALAGLRSRGHSNSSILATIRRTRIQNQTQNQTQNTVSTEEVAEDAQLMLKSLPSLTADEMILSIQELYEVNNVQLLDIIQKIKEESMELVSGTRFFSFHCDCVIRDPSKVGVVGPYRKKVVDHEYKSMKKRNYTWQCYDFWTSALRSRIIPSAGLNNFFKAVVSSDYPLHAAIYPADLAESSLNFQQIFGTRWQDLDPVMRCVAFPDEWTGQNECNMELPRDEEMAYTKELANYNGRCRFASALVRRFYLKDILPVFKRNGYSVTDMARAARNRVGNTIGTQAMDDNMKQSILLSFEGIVTNAELLQVASVLNE